MKFDDNKILWIIILLETHTMVRYIVKGTDHAGTFMSLKCVVHYANYRSWHQSSKIQVVP